jgi:hypothetical protein
MLENQPTTFELELLLKVDARSQEGHLPTVIPQPSGEGFGARWAGVRPCIGAAPWPLKTFKAATHDKCQKERRHYFPHSDPI